MPLWEEYKELITPGGALYVAMRKRGVDTPFAILTDGIETPTQVPDDMFTAPESRLTPAGPDAE